MRIRTFALASRNYLILLSFLLYVCYWLPVLQWEGRFVSVFSVAEQGNRLILAALVGYFVAMVLLFKKSINFAFLSLILYAASYFLMCFGISGSIPQAVMQRYANFLFLFLFLAAPLGNAFIYGPVISLKGEHSGRVWGVLRLINRFRGSKRLIHTIARKWELSLREGFGKEPSVALGAVQGNACTVRERFFETLGYKHSYIEMMMLALGPKIPFVVLAEKPLNEFVGHPAFPDRYYKKQANVHFRIVKFSLKWPAHTLDGITVYTNEEDLPRVRALIENVPELKKVLSGSLVFQNLNFPKVMVMEGSRISFYAEYNLWSDLFGYSSSVSHVSRILDVLGGIARNNHA